MKHSARTMEGQNKGKTMATSGSAGPPLAAPEVTGPVRVERACAELRRGLPVLVESEGEGLPALAAERVTSEILAAFAHFCSAPLAVYLTPARARTLKIRLYSPDAAAVPLPDPPDLGLVRHLADPTDDLGHPLMGPFLSHRGALAGGTAEMLALAKLAGLLPALVAPLAPVPGITARAQAAGYLSVAATDIAAFPAQSAQGLERVVAAKVPLGVAENTRIVAFRPAGGGPENLAIIVGEPDLAGPVLVRLHSECFTGDLLGSLKCDCGEQLRGALSAMAQAGSGILLYLAQEGRGIGLLNKLRAYALQDQGFDTMDANERLGFAADERLFLVAAAMLKALGVHSVRLLTNNPAKVDGLMRLGIVVAERVPHTFPANPHNARYLAVKATKGGHHI